MLILGKDTMKDPSLGYARTFVRQVEDCLGLALERGVRIVSQRRRPQPRRPRRPAPRGRAAASASTRRSPTSRATTCAPRRELGLEGALTANAYLGGFGIAAALARRRRRRGHRPGHRRLAGRRAGRRALRLDARRRTTSWPAPSSPGHVLECGTQATGGNFSGFRDLPHRRPQPLGFPLAEIAADGSCVITKHDGTGGAVTVDTVTAQLVYEIQSTRYLGPDVTTAPRHRSGSRRTGPDRVAVTGVRGEAPPERLKVCVNELGGFRNSVEFVLTGLDIEEKAAWVRAQLDAARSTRRVGRPGRRTALPPPTPTPRRAPRACCGARCRTRARRRSAARSPAPAVELALASYPGFTMTAPPGAGTPYGVYRPAYVDRAAVTHTVRARRRPPRGGRRPDRRSATVEPDARPPALAVPRARPTRSTAGCRWARSCTPAPATRAATPTSGCGWRTTASPRRTTPASPGWPS